MAHAEEAPEEARAAEVARAAEARAAEMEEVAALADTIDAETASAAFAAEGSGVVPSSAPARYGACGAFGAGGAHGACGEYEHDSGDLYGVVERVDARGEGAVDARRLTARELQARAVRACGAGGACLIGEPSGGDAFGVGSGGTAGCGGAGCGGAGCGGAGCGGAGCGGGEYGVLRGVRSGMEAYGGDSAHGGVGDGLGLDIGDDSDCESATAPSAFWDALEAAERRWAEAGEGVGEVLHTAYSLPSISAPTSPLRSATDGFGPEGVGEGGSEGASGTEGDGMGFGGADGGGMCDVQSSGGEGLVRSASDWTLGGAGPSLGGEAGAFVGEGCWLGSEAGSSVYGRGEVSEGDMTARSELTAQGDGTRGGAAFGVCAEDLSSAVSEVVHPTREAVR
eukprot:5206246-Prymnesium_polylepis.1